MLQGNLGHNLRNFLQRPRAAGEREKSIAQLDHFAFALGHVLRHDQLRQTGVLKLVLDEKFRLHTGHFTAGSQNAVCNCAHQPGFRAAINKRIST